MAWHCQFLKPGVSGCVHTLVLLVLLLQTKKENYTCSPGSLSIHTVIFITESKTKNLV